MLRALNDDNAAVRAHAIRLSERLVNKSPELLATWLRMKDDRDTGVSLQLAYSLGASIDGRASNALADLAWRRGSDPYVLAAVWSSVHKSNVGRVLRRLVESAPSTDIPPAISEAAAVLACKIGDDESRKSVFFWLTATKDGELATWQMESLPHFFAELSHTQRDHLLGGEAVDLERINRIVLAARKAAQDQEVVETRRIAALQLITAVAPSKDASAEIATMWLDPFHTLELQRAAVESLAQIGSEKADGSLLNAWSGYGPATRALVLKVVLSREAMIPALLTAIDGGQIKPGDIDAVSREQLLKHANAKIRTRAESALAGATDANRQEVINKYAAAIRLQGNAEHGRSVFSKNCSSCHQLSGEGHAVGPNLTNLTNRSASALLDSILDPNRAVDERYQSYVAVTDDGVVQTGILIRETSTSITLLEQQAKEHTVLRSSLDSLRNSGISLMPVGFEREIALQDMADLLAYLSAQWIPPKVLAGNSPQAIRPDQDGILWLKAANGSIYGQEITFESPFENIGFWHGEHDYVAWEIELDAATTYVVYLNWASTAESAGNAAVLDGGEKPLRFRVASTNGYDNYQVKAIEPLVLSTGKHRIVLRPDGPMQRRCLMDLRGIYLVRQGVSADRALAARIPTLGHSNAADDVTKLLVDLKVGTRQEYERIPGIWNVAIAAGRRNDADELTRLLELALPKDSQPLQHWQAVVVGGGIINGLSAEGHRPSRRLAELLAGNPGLKMRWTRTIELAATMVDDVSVPSGTRYDALRILGAAPFDRHRKQLIKYLGANENPELQMGAVSGLSDIESDDAAASLVAAFENLTEQNRALAIGAMLRNHSRTARLLDAIESKQINVALLNREEITQLTHVADAELQARAKKLVKMPSSK